MRSGIRIASLGILLMALCAGCARKRQPVAPPPQAQAPSLPTPAQTTAMIPPLPPLPPYSLQPILLNTAVPPETTQRPRHRIFHRRVKPEVAANGSGESAKSATQAAPNPQVASGSPSDMSPIGQLSNASGDGGSADRRTIAGLIDSTEKSLKAIKHPLSSQEQKTAAQIRTFLAHARDALESNDLDGASTLAIKAHLLLQELTSQ